MDKPKILVVEDEKDVSKVISINLRLEGMDAVEVHDGPAALEKIDELKPDCVVLDIMLPRISGWDILKFLKANPETADIPVVMVTARVEERDQLRGLGAGAVKYLTKPFSPLALTEAVKSVLKPQAKDEVARERRETIERLQLSTLHKLSDILISAPTLDELLEGVADKLIGLFDLPACAFFMDADPPELHAFKEAKEQPGKGKSISRTAVIAETRERLQLAFTVHRRPTRISELENLALDDFFPGSRELEDGYVVPLFERNNYLGAIVQAGRADVTLSPDEQDLLATIANQVAAALARARLHENLREDEIVHRRLLHQTITAQESERKRLASEIHDSVVQALVGISYRLQALEKKIMPTIYGELHDDLKQLEEQLTNSIKELREMLVGLRPPMLDEMGLFTALATYSKNFGQRTGVQASLQLPDGQPSLTRDAEINLFRIVQEALNNVEKHAEASHVTIEIEVTPNKLFLSVRDDGKGLPRDRGAVKPRKLGIASMRERTELIGGTLKMKSEAEHGTVVSLEVPLGPITEG